jgi:hypothetical protein
MGVEPTSSAWKAEVLPLNYTRGVPEPGFACSKPSVPSTARCSAQSSPPPSLLVEGGGFEPPKAEPSDLQSDPFDRSGTPPERKQESFLN